MQSKLIGACAKQPESTVYIVVSGSQTAALVKSVDSLHTTDGHTKALPETPYNCVHAVAEILNILLYNYVPFLESITGHKLHHKACWTCKKILQLLPSVAGHIDLVLWIYHTHSEVFTTGRNGLLLVAI